MSKLQDILILESMEMIKREIKQRSMIYQVEEKERIALKNGLNFDAYHDLPYIKWAQIRDKK